VYYRHRLESLIRKNSKKRTRMEQRAMFKITVSILFYYHTESKARRLLRANPLYANPPRALMQEIQGEHRDIIFLSTQVNPGRACEVRLGCRIRLVEVPVAPFDTAPLICLLDGIRRPPPSSPSSSSPLQKTHVSGSRQNEKNRKNRRREQTGHLDPTSSYSPASVYTHPPKSDAA
jgi:hypothetical protein